MQSPRRLFLIVTVLIALTSACSSIRLPEQRVQASASNSHEAQLSTAIAAIVKTNRANIREKPSKSAAVVYTVDNGDLLSLTNASPVGPWYQVHNRKTGTNGWIHGNSITLLQPAETDAGKPKATKGRSYVNVDGIRVPSPIFSETKPDGASARCRDGSYSFSLHRRGTCSHHGGVAEWF